MVVAVEEAVVFMVVAVVVVVVMGVVTDIKSHNPYAILQGNNGSFVPENKVYSRDEYYNMMKDQKIRV